MLEVRTLLLSTTSSYRVWVFFPLHHKLHPSVCFDHYIFSHNNLSQFTYRAMAANDDSDLSGQLKRMADATDQWYQLKENSKAAFSFGLVCKVTFL